MYGSNIVTGLTFITNKGEHTAGDLDGSSLGGTTTLVGYECGTTLRYLGIRFGHATDSLSLYFGLC